MIFTIRRAAASLLLAHVVAVHAQSLEELPKLSSLEIQKRASKQIPQELIVEFDVGIAPVEIAKRRVQLTKQYEAASLDQLNRETLRALQRDHLEQDALLLNELQREIQAIKHEVLAQDELGASALVQDFPNLTLAVIKISNASALARLLKHSRVKRVNENGAVYTAANWAGNDYSDMSLIGAEIPPGPGDRSGLGTRVVVIDEPAYISGLPAFNDSGPNDGSRCFPYAGLNFTNDNLAGGYNVSAGCRVWDAYNFATRAEQYCANPYGNPVGTICPHGHGTAVMDVVLRTAGGAYLTALQVFDRFGNSRDSYVLDALNWVIQNRATQPKIVAVNLSLRMGDTKYTDYCNNISAASALTSLINYGIVPVVATGNAGWKDGVNAPSCVQGVIAVGAVADSKTLPTSYPSASCSDPELAKDQVGCFSNSHPKLLTVLAPGIEIGNSKLPDELKRTGTSMAAPHVAGQVAILKGSDVHPTKTVPQIIDLIKYNGTPVRDRLATDTITTRIDIKKSIAPPKIGSFILTPATTTIEPGKTIMMTAEARDTNNAPMPIPKVKSWSTTNSGVASVDSNGLVTGKAVGTATITLSSGSAKGDSIVTVKAGRTGGNPPNCQIDPRRCE